MSGADVYHVIVAKTAIGDGKRDVDIANAIDSILDHFFLIKNRIFFYTCDSTDDKHAIRYRMFKMWYSKSQLKDGLRKEDYQMKDEHLTYYASFVFDPKNDLGEDRIVQSFNEVWQVLQESK